MARKRVYGIHCEDARNIKSIVGNTKIDVTITSPPYFDLKDYGSKNQIGYGQEYEEYLEDLQNVFSKVYDITNEDGSLWIIIDAFRKDGELIPLPFDLSFYLRKTGWIFQEVIIWEKDKTVPWAHHGQMRNIFEYILVFSKSKKYKFDADKIRETINLKQWWVKYPERYNPKGKLPVGIWEHSIPTQGSWGGKFIRHFCPLPDDLIEKIILLTTQEGDTVLDVFAGTGAVLSVASAMKRKFVGTELNPKYINKFKEYFELTNKEKIKKYTNKTPLAIKDFEDLNLKLRSLKFGRILYNNLKKEFISDILSIFIFHHKNLQENVPNKRINVNYLFLVKSKSKIKEISSKAQELVSKPPLSKYGIIPNIRYNILREFIIALEEIQADFFTYKVTSSHKFIGTFKISDFSKGSLPSIISEIKVSVNESDF